MSESDEYKSITLTVDMQNKKGFILIKEIIVTDISMLKIQFKKLKSSIIYITLDLSALWCIFCTTGIKK